MVSATHTIIFQGVDPTNLSNICIIDLDDAKRTLYVTTQIIVRYQDPNIINNYSTNNRMLRYKSIQEY